MFAANITLAQPARSRIKYLTGETFAVNDGLSQGLVNCITQDHFGFVWFGTLDGLNRYDGYNISIFKHVPDDSSSLSENFITSILEDSKKRLWVGTKSSGLNLFDYEKERFVHIRHYQGQANSISDDRILSIQEDSLGAIWVGTRNGINKIIIPQKVPIGQPKKSNLAKFFPDSNQFMIKHIRFDNSGKEAFVFHEATSSIESFTPSFFIDLKGRIFVGTKNNHFSIRPSMGFTDTILNIDALHSDIQDEKKFSDIVLVTGSSYEMKEFLFLMAKNFVAEIDAITGKVSLIKHFIPDQIQRRKANPSLSEDLWFIHNFHVYQYNAGSQQVIEIKSHEANEELLISHSTALYRDNTGIIWVGTGGYGVLKFNTANAKFHRVKTSSIHWLYSNTDDNVIVREGDSIYLLQKEMPVYDSAGWRKNTDFFREIYSRLKGKYFSAAIQETGGPLLLQAEGIQRYDLQKKILEPIVKKPIAWSALYLDDESTFWFADDTLLCKLNIKSATEDRIPFPLKNSIPDFYVEIIFRDAGHVVWVGTTAGLFSYDENQQHWTQYAFRSNDTTSLSSNLVFSICADKDDDYLWIGTNGGGFNRFNKITV